MKRELKIRKCFKCGNVVRVLEEGEGTIICCGEEMKLQAANSVDAAVEKHVPTYEKVGDKIKVKVNHVMEEEHYIEWICLLTEKEEFVVNLKPGEEAIAEFPYVKDSTIYEYCNKHGLWKKDVE